AITPEKLLAWAMARGFDRLDMVESPGDVAMRGDLVDLFAFGETSPFRIQFYDDHVESIRWFDVGTQRSIYTLNSMTSTALPKEATRVVATKAVVTGNAKGVGGNPSWESTFLQYLPKNAVIVLDGPREIQELGATLQKRLGSARLCDVRTILAQATNF